jgi:hypothetical protein
MASSLRHHPEGRVRLQTAPSVRSGLCRALFLPSEVSLHGFPE